VLKKVFSMADPKVVEWAWIMVAVKAVKTDKLLAELLVGL